MITVIGSAAMDLAATVAHLPQPGETLRANRFAQLPGGKGANVAAAAARAGSEVQLIASVGDDAWGHAVLASLEEAGVGVAGVTVQADCPTGLAMIVVDESGGNQIIAVPGANGLLGTEDVERSRDVIARTDVLLVQLETPVETVRAGAELAREYGATVILNPSPASAFELNLVDVADVLVLNASEAHALTHLDAPVDPRLAAHMLLDGQIQAVVLTRGAEGCVVISEEGTVEIAGFAVDAVDTTGAGDAFAGNLAHALEAGQPLVDAARFACAAGALAVTQPGALTSMPLLDHTLALLKEHPLP